MNLQNTAIERQGGFIEQKPLYVRELPIPTVTKDMKAILSDKVGSLLILNKERDEMLQQAIEVLKNEFAIKKFTKRLGNFLSLGWNEFIEELEKQHTLFSLNQKDELNKWFRDQIIEQKIKRIDESIDGDIYKLYQLSNNDIQVILRSIQRENPIIAVAA